MNESKTLTKALQDLTGEQWSSVEFVREYVQVRFNGPCLTVYTTAHKVTKGGAPVAWGDPGYRDALCGLISHVVKKVLFTDSQSLSLTFDDNSMWSVSLRDEDYHGPEALMYTDDLRELCFVV